MWILRIFWGFGIESHPHDRKKGASRIEVKRLPGCRAVVGDRGKRGEPHRIGQKGKWGHFGMIGPLALRPWAPLARFLIFDASISCSQHPICPGDVIERPGVFEINLQMKCISR